MGTKGNIDVLSEIEEGSNADSDGLSNNDISRLLQKKDIQELLEESGDDDSKEEEEEEEEKEAIKGKEEYVPIVSADCADTEGLIEVAESGDKLNCRKIRKSKLCDKEHNGKHLYESCQKSCEICVEPIPTTDAPTADLLELVTTIDPTEYESVSPC